MLHLEAARRPKKEDSVPTSERALKGGKMKNYEARQRGSKRFRDDLSVASGRCYATRPPYSLMNFQQCVINAIIVYLCQSLRKLM